MLEAKVLQYSFELCIEVDLNTCTSRLVLLILTYSFLAFTNYDVITEHCIQIDNRESITRAIIVRPILYQ